MILLASKSIKSVIDNLWVDVDLNDYQKGILDAYRQCYDMAVHCEKMSENHYEMEEIRMNIIKDLKELHND